MSTPKTFISGFNTLESIGPSLSNLPPEMHLAGFEKLEKFMKTHFVQIQRHGHLSPETISALVEKHGIVRGLKVEVIRFDPSGKGRHSRIKLAA